MMCFSWVFVGLGDNFTEFPYMGHLVLVETDVVYVCKVCYCFLAQMMQVSDVSITWSC